MSEETKEELVRLPIEWHISKDIISRYANNFIIQHSQDEFIISFFEIFPPIILGTPEEQKAQLEQVESIPAECIGRIILSAEKMPAFIEALQTNLEKYKSRVQEME